MRALGYAEVAIVVEDAARSAEFYVGLLGYTEAHLDTYTPPTGSRIIRVGPDHFLGLWEPGIWSSDYLDGAYGDYFGKNVGQGSSGHGDRPGRCTAARRPLDRGRTRNRRPHATRRRIPTPLCIGPGRPRHRVLG